MRSWAERAVATATLLGDRALLAAALSVRAWAGAMAGDGEQAQAHCDEATELVDELSDEEVARRLNTLAHLTAADAWLDRYPATTRHARRALEICRRTGQGEQFPLIVQMLGASLWVQGKPLEAEELFDGAVEAARLADNVQNLAWNLFNRSLAALAAGDLDVALATAEESFELEADMEPGPISAATAATLASALLEAGQADRSVDLLLTSRRGGTPRHRRRVAGALPRGAHPRSARDRQTGRRRTGRGGDPGLRRRGLFADRDRDGEPRGGRNSPSTQASRRPPSSVRSRRPPHSSRRKHSGTRPGHESSPDEHSLRQETPIAQPSSSSWPQPHSTPSARSATATRPSANSASSAAEFTAARAQARPTGTGSRR